MTEHNRVASLDDLPAPEAAAPPIAEADAGAVGRARASTPSKRLTDTLAEALHDLGGGR